MKSFHESIKKNFPYEFDFYEIGKATQQPNINLKLSDIPIESTEMAASAFRIYSPETHQQAWILFCYPTNSDESLFVEFGNIFSSKTANELDLYISPPVHLRNSQLKKVQKYYQDSKVQIYQLEGDTIYVVSLPIDLEGKEI
tara:strand:+ start:409 stop:834 length:426 start_codon:yes stop_codon:yes gene_type:complete